MTRYHVNTEGKHGVCRAQNDKCPFVHGESIHEARSNYEAEMEREHSVTAVLSKTKHTTQDSDILSPTKTPPHPLSSRPAEPMSMTFMRNTVSSKLVANNDDFAQSIEPSGRYMIKDDMPDRDLNPGWERGEITFTQPLYIEWGDINEGYHHEDNWKQRLSRHYGGKTGKELSLALRREGFDAIVTHDKYGTSEIIDLTHLPSPKSAPVEKSGVKKIERKKPTWNRRKKYEPYDSKEYAKYLEEKHPGVRIWLDGKKDDKESYVTLGKIIIPESQRGKGKGRKIMKEIITEADRNGWKLALTPDDIWGSSVTRLKKFYAEFGFKENKGRNRDYSTMESMIRSRAES